jgi:hypothetical protein
LNMSMKRKLTPVVQVSERVTRSRGKNGAAEHVVNVSRPIIKAVESKAKTTKKHSNDKDDAHSSDLMVVSSPSASSSSVSSSSSRSSSRAYSTSTLGPILEDGDHHFKSITHSGILSQSHHSHTSAHNHSHNHNHNHTHNHANTSTNINTQNHKLIHEHGQEQEGGGGVGICDFVSVLSSEHSESDVITDSSPKGLRPIVLRRAVSNFEVDDDSWLPSSLMDLALSKMSRAFPSVHFMSVDFVVLSLSGTKTTRQDLEQATDISGRKVEYSGSNMNNPIVFVCNR